MAILTSSTKFLFFSVTFLCWILLKASAASNSNTALFIFGDSSVDAGNNNYINTIPENKADVKPYGQNGFFTSPTGRFSDGRVIVDYIAEYAKLPLIPPFLQRSADYSYGANFASGGSGILPETNQGTAIDLQTQLKNFEEVKKSLIEKAGEAKANEIIAEAVYFISIGSNDYLGGYMGNPITQQIYIPEVYVGMVIGNLTDAIQALYEKGARKFAFLSLCPLGCLPIMRALNPAAEDGNSCFEAASTLALAHNNALGAVLKSLEHLFKGFKYCNSNFFTWLTHRINHPSQYGFKDGVNACCGSGPYGGIFTCGGNKKENSEFKLCDDSNEYVWWDSFHPTERIHEQFAKTLWNGPLNIVGPYNLEALFFYNQKLTIADIVDAPDGQQQIF